MSPIAKEMLEEIHRHAVAEYPFECCGIITGKTEHLKEDTLYRCANIQNKLHEQDPETFVRDARTAFYIDPKELLGVLKEAEREKKQVKIFYHSHPDHDAYFSEEDKNMALFDHEPTYPGAIYLVVSVYNGTVKDQALFTWDETSKSFQRQEE